MRVEFIVSNFAGEVQFHKGSSIVSCDKRCLDQPRDEDYSVDGDVLYDVLLYLFRDFIS